MAVGPGSKWNLLKLFKWIEITPFSPPYFLNLDFLFYYKKRLTDFSTNHSRCCWEAHRGWQSASGGSGGLSNCYLCDYTARSAGPFLYEEDAAQPSAHIYLSVWIGEGVTVGTLNFVKIKTIIQDYMWRLYIQLNFYICYFWCPGRRNYSAI